jgi:hypothetical protein
MKWLSKLIHRIKMYIKFKRKLRKIRDEEPYIYK